MGVKQRRAIAEQLAAIPNSEERVLLATGRYIGEGFDDARLDTLFLALPISWHGTLQHYAGLCNNTSAVCIVSMTISAKSLFLTMWTAPSRYSVRCMKSACVATKRWDTRFRRITDSPFLTARSPLLVATAGWSIHPRPCRGVGESDSVPVKENVVGGPPDVQPSAFGIWNSSLRILSKKRFRLSHA